MKNESPNKRGIEKKTRIRSEQVSSTKNEEMVKAPLVVIKERNAPPFLSLHKNKEGTNAKSEDVLRRKDVHYTPAMV